MALSDGPGQARTRVDCEQAVASALGPGSADLLHLTKQLRFRQVAAQMDQEPRLLADCMLGRLAKWLRLMGYDTAYDNAAADAELARRARSEERILLTSDRELAQRRGLPTILVQSQVLEDQVREVCAALPQLARRRAARCALCNRALEAVTRAEAKPHVPPYVLSAYDEFQRCPECGRVYWPGSHSEAIDEQIGQFLSREVDDS